MRNLLLFELIFPPLEKLILIQSFAFSLKFNYEVSWHDFLWIYPVWNFLSVLNV